MIRDFNQVLPKLLSLCAEETGIPLSPIQAMSKILCHNGVLFHLLVILQKRREMGRWYKGRKKIEREKKILGSKTFLDISLCHIRLNFIATLRGNCFSTEDKIREELEIFCLRLCKCYIENIVLETQANFILCQVLPKVAHLCLFTWFTYLSYQVSSLLLGYLTFSDT